MNRQVPSPFGPEQVIVVQIPNLNSQVYYREEKMYKKFPGLIENVAQRLPGNTAAFCVSKEFMRNILITGLQHRLEQIGKPLFVETANMSSQENSKMIEQYKANGDKRKGELFSCWPGRAAGLATGGLPQSLFTGMPGGTGRGVT